MQNEELVPLILRRPATPEGEARLQNAAADAYADCILQAIRSLPCPQDQKEALFQGILDRLSRR